MCIDHTIFCKTTCAWTDFRCDAFCVHCRLAINCVMRACANKRLGFRLSATAANWHLLDPLHIVLWMTSCNPLKAEHLPVLPASGLSSCVPCCSGCASGCHTANVCRFYALQVGYLFVQLQQNAWCCAQSWQGRNPSRHPLNFLSLLRAKCKFHTRNDRTRGLCHSTQELPPTQQGMERTRPPAYCTINTVGDCPL